jgi:hypothetical protein
LMQPVTDLPRMSVIRRLAEPVREAVILTVKPDDKPARGTVAFDEQRLV